MTPKISRESLNWLILEAIAIVFSILLAFWINAWWQAHSDRVRAGEYLLQLRLDTLENQQRLIDALQLEKGQQGVVQEILATLRGTEPMTLESATVWAQTEPGFMWYSDPRLLDGTIKALVATGDINLIGDPRVKSSLIKYLGALTADQDEFHRGVNQFLIHHDELLRVLELARHQAVSADGITLAQELLSIRDDRNAAVVFRQLEKNIASRTWYLEQMLAATQELNRLLDQAGDP